jgi:hypothetical protein
MAVCRGVNTLLLRYRMDINRKALTKRLLVSSRGCGSQNRMSLCNFVSLNVTILSLDAFSVFVAVCTRSSSKTWIQILSRFHYIVTSDVTSEPSPRVLIKFSLLPADISDWILTF